MVECKTEGGAVLVAGERVAACLFAAGGPTSPAALTCLADLANAIGATTNEILCVVAAMGRGNPAEVGMAGLDGPPVDAKTQAARAFLAAHRIVLR